MLLAGDIGGTKTVLALFSRDEGAHTILKKKKYRSKKYDSLDDIVREFTAEFQANIEAASFGVAGPVQNNRVQVTNLPWMIDGRTLSETLGGATVHLLNDLQAIANAVPILQPEDLRTLQTGETDPTGAIGVIAPGTGLGEAFLVWNGRNHQAYPTEGGHTDFAPRNEQEFGLLQYLRQKYNRVSYERVCSGIGIPNVYAYLRDSGRAAETEAVAAQLAEAEDWTPVIVDAAVAEASPLCQATLDLFISILGAEAGNLALKLLTTGGIYIGGGIPPRILPQIEASDFLASFQQKGRFSPLLTKMPVHVILSSQAALYGAARDALDSEK
jgi:glucokinase